MNNFTLRHDKQLTTVSLTGLSPFVKKIKQYPALVTFGIANPKTPIGQGFQQNEVVLSFSPFRIIEHHILNGFQELTSITLSPE